MRKSPDLHLARSTGIASTTVWRLVLVCSLLVPLLRKQYCANMPRDALSDPAWHLDAKIARPGSSTLQQRETRLQSGVEMSRTCQGMIICMASDQFSGGD